MGRIIAILNTGNFISDNAKDAIVHAARRWGAVINTSLFQKDDSIHPCWEKHDQLYALSRDNDVFYVDGDCLINKHTPSPFEVFALKPEEEPHFKMVVDHCGNHPDKVRAQSVIDEDVHDLWSRRITADTTYWPRFNAGVIFMHQGAFTDDMIEASRGIRSMDVKDRTSGHFEQAAFNLIVQQFSVAAEMPAIWNGLYPNLDRWDCYIRHYTGIDFPRRGAIMTSDWSEHLSLPD